MKHAGLYEKSFEDRRNYMKKRLSKLMSFFSGVSDDNRDITGNCTRRRNRERDS